MTEQEKFERKRALIKLALTCMLRECEKKMESLTPGTSVLVHLPSREILEGEVRLVFKTIMGFQVRVLVGQRLVSVPIKDVEIL